VSKIFYGWWVVFACFLISAYVVGSANYSFTAFFEPIALEFGWSYTLISIAASIRGLEQGFFAPVVGILVDRYGARILLFCGTLAIGIGFIMLSLTNSLTMFYSATVVQSLGYSACAATVMTTAVANWFRRDVGKALGIISSGAGAAGLLVPVSIFLINCYQWRTAFVILGFGMWLLGIPLSLIVRGRPEQYGYLPDGTASDKQSISLNEQDREANLREALKTRVFWHLSFAEAIRLMAIIALLTHIIPYLSSLGVLRSRAALVATSITVLSIIGRLVFGWLGDNFNKYNVLALAYFLSGVSFLLFAYAQMAWSILLFLILFPLSWGAPPLRGAILREYFGRASLGSILGIMGAIGTVARILGPTLAGWTYDNFGSYHLIWLFYAATFGVAVVLTLTIKPRQKHAR
jgi:sugar phosphate permease